MIGYPTLDAWDAKAAEPGWVKAWCPRCDRWHFHRRPLRDGRHGEFLRAVCVTAAWPMRVGRYRLEVHNGVAPSIEELRSGGWVQAEHGNVGPAAEFANDGVAGGAEFGDTTYGGASGRVECVVEDLALPEGEEDDLAFEVGEVVHGRDVRTLGGAA